MSVIIKGMEIPENCHKCQLLYTTSLCDGLRDCPLQPIRHGEWFISIGKDGDPVGTICSICGFAWSEALAAVMLMPSLSLIKTPYCPNCGAPMDLEASNE